MQRLYLIVIGSLVSLVVLISLLASGDRSRSRNSRLKSGTSVQFFCAASNRAVVEAVVADYQKETGRAVSIQYGPSQTLLSTMELTQAGDLYLPADDSFLQTALDKGLITEVIPLARMQAVVAVRKGNPKQISSFEDLLRDDVRLVQANPDAAAVAKLIRELLLDSGDWDRLDAATIGYRTTVTDVANDLLVGAADAGIVYDAVLHPYTDLESVELPEFKAAASQVSVGIIAGSEQPQAALHFGRYLSARDRGLKHYEQHGFRTGTGDMWSEKPQISIFAGSMLRPAIDETITRFEEREGVEVSRVYNGCGILVGQMKLGQHPDAFFACDNEFMEQVVDLFPEPTPVSQNELVILVQKGNPHKIGSLRDLTRPGLRVGVGHEKQCAMGWITQNTFREGGVQQEVMANVTVQAPTGDMLVNQLRTGALDAAVAYLSNATGAAEELDAVRIQGIACAIAVQPWAVAQDSRYPQTTNRLFAAICSAESQEDFVAEGFRWQLSDKSQAMQ